MATKEDGRIVETATEARGARPGRPVLVVLAVSMVLIVALFIFAYVGALKL